MFQEIGRGKVPENPNAYIYAIARNVLARQRRREIAERAALDEYRRHVTADTGRSASHIFDAEPLKEALTSEAERVLKTAAANLPAKHADLIALRVIEGLSTKQIAQRTNCSENAVRKRIRKVRTILRRLHPE